MVYQVKSANKVLMIAPLNTISRVFNLAVEAEKRIVSVTNDKGTCTLHFNGRANVLGVDFVEISLEPSL